MAFDTCLVPTPINSYLDSCACRHLYHCWEIWSVLVNNLLHHIPVTFLDLEKAYDTNDCKDLQVDFIFDVGELISFTVWQSLQEVSCDVLRIYGVWSFLLARIRCFYKDRSGAMHMNRKLSWNFIVGVLCHHSCSITKCTVE